MYKQIFIISLILLFISCKQETANIVKVANIQELDLAIKNVKPGDEIVLVNGVWKDVAVLFKGNGTKENPITLRAETPGEVIIEGKSYLKLGGEYLVVSGLYFKNGYTPSSTIIEYRINADTIANNCKITQCVIDGFTQLDREKQDHWVEFWGRNNEFSNNYIAGKSNPGPTIMVYLKGNEHIKNKHQIVNNHFGPKPRTGGPHGETLQIGDSGTSMTPSELNVENNFFERCNGEVEIISSKSNNNTFKNNIFFECEGSLVLRHGNYATIDGNIFIGNDNSAFIGGVRVVNTGHWIQNNYFYKIKGDEFRSALAVMNGIPKSPLNRYNQVTDVVVAYNSFVDCKSPWQFSVGANTDKSDVLPASEIRSARPVRTIFANNLIYNNVADEFPVKNYNKVDGVTFKNNILNSKNNSEVQNEGIQTTNFEMTKLSDWLYVPTQNNTNVYVGFDFENITTDVFGTLRNNNNALGAVILPVNEGKAVINKKLYGASWFSNENPTVTPNTFQVANETELAAALEKAVSGDILELTAASYIVSTPLLINKHITIKAADINKKALISYNGTTNTPVFQLLPKGNLILESVILKGNNEQNAFATLDKNMSVAYNLFLNEVEISDFKNVLKTSIGSFADTISITNSKITNCFAGILLAEEIDDRGDYSAEFVKIKNSVFENVQENVINYYRGGYDESTIGGNFVLQNNSFTNCGKKDADGILVKTRGIVNVTFENNKFTNNPVKLIAILWGEKGQEPINNTIVNSGKIEVQQNLKLKLMY
jgi:poly(beta-D-mannuronate) lyase